MQNAKSWENDYFQKKNRLLKEVRTLRKEIKPEEEANAKTVQLRKINSGYNHCQVEQGSPKPIPIKHLQRVRITTQTPSVREAEVAPPPGDEGSRRANGPTEDEYKLLVKRDDPLVDVGRLRERKNTRVCDDDNVVGEDVKCEVFRVEASECEARAWHRNDEDDPPKPLQSPIDPNQVKHERKVQLTPHKPQVVPNEDERQVIRGCCHVIWPLQNDCRTEANVEEPLADTCESRKDDGDRMRHNADGVQWMPPKCKEMRSLLGECETFSERFCTQEGPSKHTKSECDLERVDPSKCNLEKEVAKVPKVDTSGRSTQRATKS